MTMGDHIPTTTYNNLLADNSTMTTTAACGTVVGSGIGTITSTAWPYNMTSAAMTATAVNPALSGTITIPSNFSMGTSMHFTPPHIVQFSNNGQEIVKMKSDGSIEWANGIQIDEAAEAFGKSLAIGAEYSAGITKRVKLEMRDSVFEDLIAIAKERGSLTAEDLTFLLQGSKIVEKLKGGKYES